MKRAALDRPISPPEIAVIQVMLERAAVAPEYSLLGSDLSRLRVVERCSCGCDSVDFKKYDPQARSKPIADGTGETVSGGQVGVIIWGTSDAVTGIEVYDLGAGENDIRLPSPDSVRPW
jgi:hypothetical protein